MEGVEEQLTTTKRLATGTNVHARATPCRAWAVVRASSFFMVLR